MELRFLKLPTGFDAVLTLKSMQKLMKIVSAVILLIIVILIAASGIVGWSLVAVEILGMNGSALNYDVILTAHVAWMTALLVILLLSTKRK